MFHLRMEMEQIKLEIARLMADRQGELQNVLQESLDRQLSEEWIVTAIDKAVNESIRKAIESMPDDYRLRNLIKDAIVNAMAPVDKA